MLNEAWVEKTEAFLRQSFETGAGLASRKREKAYRLAHSYRVANIGRSIARLEGLDETGLVIACLLHDVAYCEEFGENGWREHGRRSAQIARPFLTELGMPKEQVDELCYGIAIHVDDEAGFPGERSALALTIGDADNIDRFDVYRLHEWLSRDGFLEMSEEEKAVYTKKHLTRLHKLKATPMGTRTAEELWEERFSFLIAFFEKLSAQLESGRRIIN